jgi:hypothetical protein
MKCRAEAGPQLSPYNACMSFRGLSISEDEIGPTISKFLSSLADRCAGHFVRNTVKTVVYLVLLYSPLKIYTAGKGKL